MTSLTCAVLQTWNMNAAATRELIVTQIPLADTITDLWRLIADESCYTVVMLDEPETDECRVSISLSLSLSLSVSDAGFAPVISRSACRIPALLKRACRT